MGLNLKFKNKKIIKQFIVTAALASGDNLG